MIIFDGNAQAALKESKLKTSAAVIQQPVGIAAVLFSEDSGSRLYTSLKHDAAHRVGMTYRVKTFSIADPIDKVRAAIQELNEDSTVTGIIIQKPTKRVWATHQPKESQLSFNSWWQSLVSMIELTKDVDGLHPQTLAAVAQGEWRESGAVLPATCQAVLEIIELALVAVVETESLSTTAISAQKVLIIGKSDLLGNPLYHVLRHLGADVELLTRKDFQERCNDGRKLHDADIVVSATGQKHLVTGDLLRKNCIVIDVGEPQPDVDRASVADTASFLTPVPGGVGPMTVVSLLENAITLVSARN